jgi:hypothetical protein
MTTGRILWRNRKERKEWARRLQSEDPGLAVDPHNNRILRSAAVLISWQQLSQLAGQLYILTTFGEVHAIARVSESALRTSRTRFSLRPGLR